MDLQELNVAVAEIRGNVYNSSRGSRPAFTLPSTIHVRDDMLIA